MSQAIPGFTPPPPPLPYQGNLQQAPAAVVPSGMEGDSIAPVVAEIGGAAGALLLGSIAVAHFATSTYKPKPAQATSPTSKPLKRHQATVFDRRPEHIDERPPRQPVPHQLASRQLAKSSPPLWKGRQTSQPVTSTISKPVKRAEAPQPKFVPEPAEEISTHHIAPLPRLTSCPPSPDRSPQISQVELIPTQTTPPTLQPVEGAQTAKPKPGSGSTEEILQPSFTPPLGPAEEFPLPPPTVPLPQPTRQSQYITVPGLPGFIDPSDPGRVYREQQEPEDDLCGKGALNTIFIFLGVPGMTTKEYKAEIAGKRATVDELMKIARKRGLEARPYDAEKIRKFGIDDTSAFIIVKPCLTDNAVDHAVAMVRTKKFHLSDSSDQDKREEYPAIPKEALLDYQMRNNVRAHGVITFRKLFPAQSAERPSRAVTISPKLVQQSRSDSSESPPKRHDILKSLKWLGHLITSNTFKDQDAPSDACIDREKNYYNLPLR